MRNAGRVLSKTMIMEHVWDYDFDPQTNVVDVLVSRLRSKIDKDYDEKLIHTVRGVGYVLKTPQGECAANRPTSASSRRQADALVLGDFLLSPRSCSSGSPSSASTGRSGTRTVRSCRGALGYVVRYRTAVTESAGINLLVNQLSNDILTPAGRPFFARIATDSTPRSSSCIPLRDWQGIDLSVADVRRRPPRRRVPHDRRAAFGYQLEVLGVRLSERYVLQIGSDTRNRSPFCASSRRAFFFTFVIMLGVSLAGGLFFASRSLRPIERSTRRCGRSSRPATSTGASRRATPTTISTR